MFVLVLISVLAALQILPVSLTFSNILLGEASSGATSRRNFVSLTSAAIAGTGANPASATTAVRPEVSSSPPWTAAFSGAVQGVAQNIVKQLILHPFDTVKTRLQVETETVSRADLFRDVYRGILPCIVSGTPGSAAFFAAKEAATASLRDAGLSAPLPTLGGVVSGVLLAKAVRTPFDVAETKAMARCGSGDDSLGWDGSLSAVRESLEREGLPGLYRGYGANVLYKLPADATKFLAYEALRGSGAAGSLPPGVAGALATLASNAVTTPLDVVRTRVMVQAGSPSSRQGNQKNVLEMFQSLITSNDGAAWSGLGWRIARGVVAGAIQFTVLEGTKDAVEGRR